MSGLEELAVGGDPQASGVAASVKGLTKAFGDRTVLDGLDLDVAPGEFVALLGASGCGKTTLLRVLAGLDHEFRGTVQVAQQRGVAFQSPRLLPWKRVWRNVVFGVDGRPDRARALGALEEVGLAHLANAWPKTISGGEGQRVALARALVGQPDLLLLDEPFASLDALTRLRAQELVADLWWRHGFATVLVTHDVDEALLLADRIVLMRNGVLAHDHRIDLPRPRRTGAQGLAELRVQLLSWLGVD